MDEWVERALAKWPNVPALFGWMGLDRRGRWLIKGAPITRPQLVELIGRNYAADEHGRWYYQNGPQRAFVDLEYAPLILRVKSDGGLVTHTGRQVEHLQAVYLDAEGQLLLVCEHGPGLLHDADLDWALARLGARGRDMTEADLEAALALPSGEATVLSLRTEQGLLPVIRLDAEAAPAALGFVVKPAPIGGEMPCEGAPRGAAT